MWIYKQSTGQLFNKDNALIGTGYAGSGKGKNNPALQEVENVGPLPRGLYTMKPPVNTVSHGPYAIRLEPHPENQMFGRDGFLCHGERIGQPPGNASLGCMIQNILVRKRMWGSGEDPLLEVIA